MKKCLLNKYWSIDIFITWKKIFFCILSFLNLQEANIKGVDQDEGLSKMLDSDSSSDEENKVWGVMNGPEHSKL